MIERLKEIEKNPRVLILPASIGLEGRTMGGGERYATEYTRALAKLTHAEQALFCLHPSILPKDAPPTRVLTWTDSERPILPPFTRSTWKALSEYDVLHLMCFPNSVADGFLASGISRSQLVILTDIGGGGRCCSTYLSKVHPRLNPYRHASGFAHLSDYAGSLFPDWKLPSTILHGGARQLFPPGTGRFDGYALFVGRLLPHKGVHELVQAMPESFELRIVGRPYDNQYFELLKQSSQGKRVRFLTDADDEELARQYQGATVVLQPSIPNPSGGQDRSELLGLVAIEAQSAGKPVIVTDTTSLPELVQDGVTGRIVPSHDLFALRAALESFLKSPSYSEEIGRNAARIAATRFTWESVAQRGLALYRKLLRDRGIGG
jgi:glycosyltransferase involved in cell wall biosynthesis